LGLIFSEFSPQNITKEKRESCFKTGLCRDEMQQPMTIYVDEYRKDELSR